MASYSGIYFTNILFRGILNEDDDELDFGEVDTIIETTTPEIDKIQPGRLPQLKLDYLGISGEVEILLRFKVTWEDRGSDLENYLDEVQATIEGGINGSIYEREQLGITAN